MINPENVMRIKSALGGSRSSGEFAPAVYVVEPTSRCNLRCVMCPNGRLREAQLGDIDVDEFAATMEKISPYAELVMLYFMGESTLHPNFEQISSIARSNIRGKLVLSTNAADLTSSTMDAIIANYDIVIVCIDRWDSAQYESIRRGASFDRVVSNATELLRLRGDLCAPKIIVKALDISLPLLKAAGPKEYSDFVFHWKALGAVPLAGWLNTWGGQIPNLLRLSSKKSPYDDSEAREPCADLWFKMVINWEGQVVLCCHDWSYSVDLGRIKSLDLLDLWQSESIQSVRESHLEGEYSKVAFCAGCREWGEASELDSYLRLNGDDIYRVF